MSRLRSNFSKLWTSYAISSLGDGAILSAGPLLIASKTQDPALVAGAVFAQQLPWLLFSLLSGVFVDRFDRQRLLVIANIIRATAIGGLAVAVAGEFASLPFIYIALFLLGLGDTIGDNVAVALLPNIVETSSLAKANSRLQGVNLIGRQLAGPPLGAYLFVIAAAIPFGLDAVTFVVAALLISSIRKSSARTDQLAAPQPKQSIAQEAKEGLLWLWQSPFLRTLAISIAVLNITFSAAFATFVLFVDQQLGLDAVGYGIILTVSALGGLLGLVIASPLQAKFSVTTLLRTGILIEAVINLSFANVHSPWLGGLLYATFGVHAAIWSVITISLRQQIVPPSLIGRVNSVYNVFRIGGLAVGAFLGGLAAHAYGITAPFWMAGITVTLLAALTWRSFRVSLPRKSRVS